MRRAPLERLRDAREFAAKVRQIASGMDPDIFEGVEYYHYAVRYCLLVVGEALNFVPDEVRAMASEIPWRSIINMRHRLAHDYWLINSRIVLEAAHKHIGPLIEQLDLLIAQLEAEA
ncbi:MAG TPA: HepT-like ribonuclease domain-containing protein [Beijerinckiaceae bacterium]